MLFLLAALSGCGGGADRGAAVTEQVDAEAAERAAEWVRVQGLAGQAVAGARVFATATCLQCHRYLDDGVAVGDAPDLSAVGATDKGADYFARYLADPRAFGDSVMPSYANLGEEKVAQIAAFLAASRGPRA